MPAPDGPPTIDDLAAVGLYDPGAPNAADRLALLEWLVARGVSLDEMVRAPSITGLASDLQLASSGTLQLEEVAARVGTTPEQILEISRAVGLPLPAPGERAFGEADVESFRGFLAGAALFGRVPVLQFARVLGSSLARIAEAAVALFRSELERPLVDAGGSELRLAKTTLQAIQTLDVLPASFAAILPGHMRAAIRRFRGAQESGRLDVVRVTIGFVDLVGFTPLSQQLGTDELGALVERFESLAHEVTSAHDSRVVKLVGDAVMFVAREPLTAAEVALTLIDRCAGDTQITPRGGLADGPVLIRGGDYYGPIVNLAARLSELAVPREVLVTAEVAGGISGERLRCEPAGRRQLKGFAEPIALFTVERG